MSRASFWRRRETWGAVLLAVLFHAGMFLLVQATWPPVLRAHTTPLAPHLAYLPDEASGMGGSAWDADPRALNSPVLFALPTAAGFSPSSRAGIQTLPPLARATAPASLWLDRLPASAPDPEPLHARTAPEVEDIWVKRWVALSALEDPYAVPLSTAAVLRVDWPEGKPDIVAGLPLALTPVSGDGEKPWTATASVYFSEFGDVQNVFIEQSTASRDQTAVIPPALYRLRIAPGRAVSARVKLYLDKASPLAAAMEGAP